MVPKALIGSQRTASGWLDRRVIDQTVPTGNYDFLTEFTAKVPGFWP